MEIMTQNVNFPIRPVQYLACQTSQGMYEVTLIVNKGHMVYTPTMQSFESNFTWNNHGWTTITKWLYSRTVSSDTMDLYRNLYFECCLIGSLENFKCNGRFNSPIFWMLKSGSWRYGSSTKTPSTLTFIFCNRSIVQLNNLNDMSCVHETE